MRVALRLPDHRPELGEEFTGAAAVREIARAAEAAGFDAVFVTDHPIPSPDFARVGGHHSFDPFVTLAFVAGATSRLRLLTFLVVLPYRHPFVTAKAAATLDLLSDGRLVLGVGAGYMREEFEAMGLSMSERNAFVDEAIAVMKQAWTGEPVDFEGRFVRAHGNVALPVPVQQPHPPIWVGGNSPRAMRRAVELGDGWMPLPTPPERAGVIRTTPIADVHDLERALDAARTHAAAVGRAAPLDVAFMPLGRRTFTELVAPDEIVEAAARLAELGVTDLVMQFPSTTRRDLFAAIEHFGAAAVPAIGRLIPNNTI